MLEAFDSNHLTAKNTFKAAQQASNGFKLDRADHYVPVDSDEFKEMLALDTAAREAYRTYKNAKLCQELGPWFMAELIRQEALRDEGYEGPYMDGQKFFVEAAIDTLHTPVNGARELI